MKSMIKPKTRLKALPENMRDSVCSWWQDVSDPCKSVATVVRHSFKRQSWIPVCQVHAYDMSRRRITASSFRQNDPTNRMVEVQLNALKLPWVTLNDEKVKCTAISTTLNMQCVYYGTWKFVDIQNKKHVMCWHHTFTLMNTLPERAREGHYYDLEYYQKVLKILESPEKYKTLINLGSPDIIIPELIHIFNKGFISGFG